MGYLMPRNPRDYKDEYEKYGGTSIQKKRRAKRNAARYKLIREGKAKKGDGKDVAHKDNNPNNNKKSNLKNQKRNDNRSFPRNRRGGMRKR